MIRLIILAVLIYFFVQTPTFKTEVLPRYKQFEKEVTKMLDPQTQELTVEEKKKITTTSPQPGVSMQEASDAFGEPLDRYDGRLGTGKISGQKTGGKSLEK